MAMIDWTVRPADFIGFIGALVVVVGGYFKMKGDVRVVRHDLNNVQTAVNLISETVKSISTTLTVVAVQDNRLKNLEEDIRELKHGQGFIVKPPNPV